MKFFVYSRQAVEAVAPPDVPHLFVSIRSPGDMNRVCLKTNELTRGVLSLSFHDLDPPKDVEKLIIEEEGIDPKDLFNTEHAKAILTFFKAASPVEHFIVHCDAGLSRSPAVAAAISYITTGEDTEFFKRYHPNMRVYNAILHAHFDDAG